MIRRKNPAMQRKYRQEEQISSCWVVCLCWMKKRMAKEKLTRNKINAREDATFIITAKILHQMELKSFVILNLT